MLVAQSERDHSTFQGLITLREMKECKGACAHVIMMHTYYTFFLPLLTRVTEEEEAKKVLFGPWDIPGISRIPLLLHTLFEESQISRLLSFTKTIFLSPS